MLASLQIWKMIPIGYFCMIQLENREQRDKLMSLVLAPPLGLGVSCLTAFKSKSGLTLVCWWGERDSPLIEPHPAPVLFWNNGLRGMRWATEAAQPHSLYSAPKENARAHLGSLLLGGFGMSSCRVCGSSAFKDQRRIAGSSTLWLFLSPRSHTHTHSRAAPGAFYILIIQPTWVGLNSRAYVQRTLNKSRQ